jgi:hypothetical protein
MSGGVGMHEEADMRKLRDDLLQYLNPLAAHRRLKISEPRDVTTGVSQIVYEPSADRVRNHQKNDGRTAGEGPQLSKCRVTMTKDNIGQAPAVPARARAWGQCHLGPTDVDACSGAFRSSPMF